MSSTTPRARYYSAPPHIHNVAIQYGWSESATQTGSANTVTGNYVPLAVNESGVLLQAGTVVTNISGYAPQSGLFETAGLAVVTSGFNPQYRSGQQAPFAIDNINGGELVVGSDLDRSVDSLVSYVPSATTTSNYTQSGNPVTYAMVTGNVLLSNPSRIQSYIQNLGSGILFVKLGSAPCSTGSFSFLLKGSSAVGAGYAADGGVWSDNGFWLGDVSVSGATFFTAWEA